MALEKTVTIEGVDVKLKASAALPRIYSNLLLRDIFKDFASLAKASRDAKKIQEDGDESEMLETTGSILAILENLAYVMAKHADKNAIPDTIEDWLEQFAPFALLSVQNEVMELWSANMASHSIAKKNQE